MKKSDKPKRIAPSAAGRRPAARQLQFARAVLDTLPDHIYVKDLEGRYLLVNEAGLRERKLASLADIVGKTAYDLVERGAADRMTAEDRDVMESGKPLVNREAITRFGATASDDAAPRWHITTKIPMRDAQGNVIGVLGVNRDISDRKRAENALRQSEETFRAIFDQAAVGITVMSADLRYVRVNDKFCEMLGYTRSELLSRTFVAVNPPEAREEAIDYRRQLLAGTATGHELCEKELLRKDGSRIWVGLATSLVRGEDAEPRYFVSAIADISEAKRAAMALRESEERFRHLAHYDVLTSLPNRTLFHDRLGQALAQAARNRQKLGLMLVDLDRFKQVNDTMGHAAGDLLLNQISARLLASVRAGDTVARLGGDEFAIILSSLAAPQDAGVVAQKIMACAAEPFFIEGGEISSGLSVGIALYPEDGAEQGSLLRKADAAMYEAKAAGRNGYRFYNAQLNARALRIIGTDAELRRALERKEFVLYYQPKLSVASGELVGAEALLRWAHPELGIQGPSRFMPVLEESGLVGEIGAWVLEAVCAQLARWQRERLPAVPVAANLFPRQVIRRDLASIVSRLLGEYRVAPQLFQLEMTERALMADSDEAIRMLGELSSLGIKCSIDDFGTGYSSLGIMRRFTIDALKIDRSFVHDLPGNADAAAISGAVISLAHSLGLRAIAEGVETRAQFAFLAARGCDQAQGYYFAPPMPAAEFGERLAAAGGTQHSVDVRQLLAP